MDTSDRSAAPAAGPVAVTPLSPAQAALADALDAALPQTQCMRCGYADCRAYAEAVAVGEVGIDRCPPGGAEGIARLAAIAGQAPRPLDPACGTEGPRLLARIDEAWCIGCTLCLDPCPVDAIAGAHKRLHTVIEADCTGCELCLPACPVDCIVMVPRPAGDAAPSPEASGWAAWSAALAEQARAAYQRHRERLARRPAEDAARLADKAEHKLADLAAASRLTDADALARKRSVIEAALAKARARAAGGPGSGPAGTDRG
ncbi:RnfABCDGE type electron transport complex subunit B [Pseudaquabacterium rugosum]|uniref:RnfABCDGE type electron transport complex subunit B n=1 Tax=Pseudaquabacterium rugosum TaxID=2984194 RepID=A0ABU9BGW3_9BURK